MKSFKIKKLIRFGEFYEETEWEIKQQEYHDTTRCVCLCRLLSQINYARKLEQHAYEHHLKTWYFAENNAQDVSLCLIY